DGVAEGRLDSRLSRTSRGGANRGKLRFFLFSLVELGRQIRFEAHSAVAVSNFCNLVLVQRRIWRRVAACARFRNVRRGWGTLFHVGSSVSPLGRPILCAGGRQSHRI